MGMELRTAPDRYLIGDYVGAQEADEINPQPVFGRIESMGFTASEGIFIRTAEGELTGPWSEDQIWHDPSYHVDYPHHPGTLYDCPACEVSGELDRS